jgi:hypothetical protein
MTLCGTTGQEQNNFYTFLPQSNYTRPFLAHLTLLALQKDKEIDTNGGNYDWRKLGKFLIC